MLGGTDGRKGLSHPIKYFCSATFHPNIGKERKTHKKPLEEAKPRWKTIRTAKEPVGVIGKGEQISRSKKWPDHNNNGSGRMRGGGGKTNL